MSDPLVLRKDPLRLSVLAVLAMGLGLAACSTDKANEPPPCPRVSILSDAQKMTRFRAGPGHDVTDVELTAELTSYHGSCKYDEKEQRMDVTLRIGVEAKLGPAARGREAELAYFVALPGFYPKPTAKQVETVALSFPSNTDRVRYTDDDVTVSFPLPNIKDLEKYSIVLGLQLSPAEVDYNRRQKTER